MNLSTDIKLSQIFNKFSHIDTGVFTCTKSTSFQHLFDLLSKLPDNDDTYEAFAYVSFDSNLIKMIWESMCINATMFIESLAYASFYKQIQPNVFDTWKFIDTQIWFKKFNELAENANKKNTTNEESADEQQKSMMSNAKSMMKTSPIKMQKAPKMRMPKLN